MLFYSACLRSWLEQDTSCPTCRTSLSDLHHSRDTAPVDETAPGHDEQTPAQNTRRRQRTTNRFHFDGISCRITSVYYSQMRFIIFINVFNA
jgi:E3 ubiquitin-protein ligase AMFR